MHILFLSSWYPKSEEDVTATFIREQALALRYSGNHKVGVIFPYFSSVRDADLLSSSYLKTSFKNESEIPTYRMPIPRVFNRMPLISAHVWGIAASKLFNDYVLINGLPDVIYAHAMFYAGVAARKISNKYSIPFIILEHDSGFARGFVKKWQIWLGRKSVASSAANLAVGRGFSIYLDRIYGLSKSSWQYLPNMVSAEFFNTSLRNVSSQNYFIYCIICNLNKNKGVDIAIRSFLEVLQFRPNSRLVIGGDGPEKKYLERLVLQLGLGKSIEFRGKLSRRDVIELINQSNVLISSSYYETFGLVLAEANALGRPVIATRSGGPSEIITPENGILTQIGNVHDLTGAMLRIQDIYETFSPLTIRSECQSKFGEKVFISNFENILVRIFPHSKVE